MLVPVSHKDRSAVCRFDDILQGIQLPVMDADHGIIVRIHSTVCHLGQLIRKCCGICGCDFMLRDVQDQVLFHILIPLPFLFIQGDRVLGTDEFRHFQVVNCLHGNRDVTNPVVDFLLCTGECLIGIHDIPVAAVGSEEGGSVLPDEPPKSFTHIQAPEFIEQVHKSIAAWCSGKAHHSFQSGAEF